MDQYVVFLDVDGTLVDEFGRVPDSAREAVHAARSNGHLVYLCTGRSTSSLWREILDIGFDGLVAAAGGYVESDGQVLARQHVPTAEVLRVVEFFGARGVEYLLESNDGVFGSAGARSRVRELILGAVTDEEVLAELERGIMGFLDGIVVDVNPASVRVNKFSFLHSEVTLPEIRVEFGDVFDVIPSTVPLFGPNSGELSLRGVHKAAGIQTVIEHLGVPRERTVAFGDGYNDLEMLQFAGVGIAMGNAPPAVKAHADQVTASPNDDGIASGLRGLGLI